MYMLMPRIPSSTTAKGYEQWIPLFSLNCGAGRKIETAPGRVSDRIRSDALGTEMEIIKPIDQASPLLFSEVCGGPAIPEVTIDMCHSSTDGFVMYLQYVLSNVFVSAYQAHIDAHGHYELITLNYTDVEMSFIPQDSSNLQSPIRARAQVGCWPDLATYIRRKIQAKTPDGFNLFVATVYGEASGVHHGCEAAWRAVSSVIINRINKGIWHRYHTSDDIIKHTDFNAYLNPNKINWDQVNFKSHYIRNHQQFLKAWATLHHDQKINNHNAMTTPERTLLRKMQLALLDIYNGHPITQANYYYSPRSMSGKHPSFLSHLENPEQYKVSVPGVHDYDFKFYYIPSKVERTARKK